MISRPIQEMKSGENYFARTAGPPTLLENYARREAFGRTVPIYNIQGSKFSKILILLLKTQTLGFTQASLDCQFQWEISFQEITWQWLVQSLWFHRQTAQRNICAHLLATFAILAYFGQNVLWFSVGQILCLWVKLLKLAGIDQHHQGHIWAKNSPRLTHHWKNIT